MELICAVSVSVMTSLYLLGRNIWVGVASASLIVSTTVEPNLVVSLLARTMRYLRMRYNSVTEIVVSHATPLKILGQIYYVSEERQVIGRWGFACA